MTKIIYLKLSRKMSVAGSIIPQLVESIEPVKDTEENEEIFQVV